MKMKDRDLNNPLLVLVTNKICCASAPNYLSWSSVAATVLQNADIPFDYRTEPLIYSTPPWKEKTIFFESTDLPCPKAELTHEQCEVIRKKANDDIESDLRTPGTVVIACDASIKNKKAAYATILKYKSEENIIEMKTGARLNCTVGSMSAELCGIRDSLLLTSHLLKSANKDLSIDSVVIYTDSKCAWGSLKSGNIKDNYKLFDEIFIAANSLWTYDITLKFVWIPSHIGIMMNTEVDSLADFIHFSPDAQVLNIQPSISIRMLSAISRIKAQRLYRNIEQNKHQFTRYLKINPFLKQPRTPPKRLLEILITNLRLSFLDSCLFHHKNVLCTRCNDAFSVSHYLIDCPSCEELTEAVMEIIGGGNISMNINDAAVKFLFFLAELDPNFSKELGYKLNHVYKMLIKYPILAACPNGHGVVRKTSRFIQHEI